MAKIKALRKKEKSPESLPSNYSQVLKNIKARKTANDLASLRTIISRGEDSRHQFKEDVRNADSLAAEMVAFSNSRGGHIFIGISNEGELLGLSGGDVDRVNQLISNSAGQHVRSPITVYTENILVESDRVVIVLTIPEGIDKPYFDLDILPSLKGGDSYGVQLVTN